MPHFGKTVYVVGTGLMNLLFLFCVLLANSCRLKVKNLVVNEFGFGRRFYLDKNHFLI